MPRYSFHHLLTVIVWAAVFGSGWYWVQTGFEAGVQTNAAIAPAAVPAGIYNPTSLTRVLGTGSASPAPVSNSVRNFVLSGVIANSTGRGAALISVDGKPAAPFAVGTQLAPGYVLVAVAPRQAMLADGPGAPVLVTLNIPLAETGREVQGAATSAVSATKTVTPPVPTVPSLALPTSNNDTAASATQLPAITNSSPDGPPPVPARADGRRQPDSSSRRQGRRTP